MAHETPLRPDEQETYGTEVAPEVPDPLDREVRDKTPAAGAPIWVIVGIVFLVVFVLLLVSSFFFLPR